LVLAATIFSLAILIATFGKPEPELSAQQVQKQAAAAQALTAQAAKQAAVEKSFPDYRVVSTDGTNLIVTDSRKAILYFYAIEPDGKIGDPLKLRGTLDLSKTGEPELKPTVLVKPAAAEAK
jgi:hypothetical protein